MNPLNTKKLVLALSFLVFCTFGVQAHAAILSIKPLQTEVSVGNIINVQVSLDTSGKVVNNAESSIQFPKDLLEVVSLDTRSSIFSLWVEQPSFANNVGQVVFNGGVPNPGFNGNNGTIISIIFRAKKTGTASILFSNSAVRENDGLGTDIFSGQKSATVNIINKEVVPVAEPVADTIPQISIIKSDTHPDQEKWYSDNTPAFYWDLPDGALELKTLIGHSSTGEPTTKYTQLISEKKVDPLPDGIYYFSLQIRTASGWSGVYRYRVNIDTTPPKAFSIKFPNGNKSLDPEPTILFGTTDNESGISHYDIRVGDGEAKRAAPFAASNPYTLPTQYPGKHTVVVKAIDLAGNSISASADFTVEGIEPPIITSYQEEIEEEDIIKIRGTTYPDSDVTVILRGDAGIMWEESTRSNNVGDFLFIATKNPDQGVYKFTARVTNSKGARSEETIPLAIVVKSKFLTTLVGMVINYLSVIILILIALGGILIGWTYIWRRYLLIIRRMKKESHEAETVLAKSFNILRKDLREHISKLRRVEAKRKLTSEEVEFLEHFEEELSEAESVIEKEIKDISES